VEEVPRPARGARVRPDRRCAASLQPVRGVEARGRQREFAGHRCRGLPPTGLRSRAVRRRSSAPVTPEARIAIPYSWQYSGRAYHLTPGTYRWAVRAAFRTHRRIRYGTPVVSSRLTVTG